MLKKQLLWTSGIIILLFFILGGVFCYQIMQSSQSARGQYTFKNTRQNIGKLTGIKINTPQNGEINVYLRNGTWYVEEAKNYYVNSQAIADFFSMVNNSLIISQQKNFAANFPSNSLLSESESTNLLGMGTQIKTYDARGNLLDDVIIGRPAANGGYRFARQKMSADQQIVSSADKFSGLVIDWLPQPLLQIDRSLVKKIDFNGQVFDANQLDYLWHNSELVKDFFAELSNISYQGIIYRDEFAPDAQRITPQHFRIIMLGGLIYDIKIYEVEENYFMSVELDSERVAHKDVFPFIEENQKYFDEWLFMLLPETGMTLHSLQYIPHDKE